MLARLRYLLTEGFEVSSLGGCEDKPNRGNAAINIVERSAGEKCRTRTEFFEVNQSEMEACSSLFHSHMTKRG